MGRNKLGQLGHLWRDWGALEGIDDFYLTVELELKERRLRLFPEPGGGGMTMLLTLRRSAFGVLTFALRTERRRVFIAGESTLKFAVLSVMSAMSDISDTEVMSAAGMGMELNLNASSLNSASGRNWVST